MKAPLVYSLYLEVKDENFPQKYRGVDLMDYAVRRLGEETVALRENLRSVQYEQLERLYGLSVEQIETLFVPYKTYGKFAEFFDGVKLQDDYGVYPSSYDWGKYREIWLVYFPMWLILWGWHPDDFQGCEYWVISPGHNENGYHPHVNIYYGLAQDASDCLQILQASYPGLIQPSILSPSSSHALAQAEKSLLQASAPREIIEFSL